MAFSVLSLNVRGLNKTIKQATSGFSMAAPAKIGCSIFAGDILFCAKHKIVGSRMGCKMIGGHGNNPVEE